jgi:hypothetical protein
MLTLSQFVITFGVKINRMIIKEWSKPAKPDVWAQYAGKRNLLLVLALVGNLISGFSEFKALDEWYQGVIAVLLLEGGIWFFGAMFLDHLFNSLRNKDLSSIIFTVIGGVGVVFVVYLSMNLSMIGKTNYIDDTFEAPTEELVDSSKYRTLEKQAIAAHKSDSLRKFALYSRLKITERDSLEKNITLLLKKKRRIMNYADYSYEKYANSIRGIEANVARNRKGLKQLNDKYKTLLDNGLAQSEAIKQDSLSAASSYLVSEMDNVSDKNQKKKKEHEIKKAAKQFFVALLVRFGIVATLFYLFFNELGRYLSGSKPIYKNPFGGVMSPFTRMKIGLNIRWRNGLEKIADMVVPDDEIKVNGRKFNFIIDDDGKEAIKINPKKQPTPTLSPIPAMETEKTNEEEPRKIGFFPKDEVSDPLTNSLVDRSGGIQKPVLQDFSNQNTDEQSDYIHNYETYDTINTRMRELKVFDYTKHVVNLKNTYKKMKLMYKGEKKKTTGWEVTAKDRLKKVMQLTNNLVNKGYKVTINESGVVVDPVTSPSMEDYKKSVVVFNAPNKYRFPIYVNYIK